MNSWKSREFSACRPPLMTFIMGTGSRYDDAPPRYWYSGMPMAEAVARAAAIETPSMALAPSFDLFSVPSSAINAASTVSCGVASERSRRSRIAVLTFEMALRTPLPPYRATSPSRSSRASYRPVEAPDGTEAMPQCPLSSFMTTRSVGLPRESRISKASIVLIAKLIGLIPENRRELTDDVEVELALEGDRERRELLDRSPSPGVELGMTAFEIEIGSLEQHHEPLLPLTFPASGPGFPG